MLIVTLFVMFGWMIDYFVDIDQNMIINPFVTHHMHR
jgi:hypothetical protein